MIRLMQEDDIEDVLQIWLLASEAAHSFVGCSFWAEKLGEMRDVYLPQTENWVCEEENEVVGFLSLNGNRVEAIFVHPEKQGKGVGTALMRHAKSLKGDLELNVYAENESSVAFYQKEGFQIAEEGVEPHTNCRDFLMRFTKTD